MSTPHLPAPAQPLLPQLPTTTPAATSTGNQPIVPRARRRAPSSPYNHRVRTGDINAAALLHEHRTGGIGSPYDED